MWPAHDHSLPHRCHSLHSGRRSRSPDPTIIFSRPPLSHMADSHLSGDAIFRVVQASLKVASRSSELLTMDHLRALKFELHVTLAVISGQIQSEESGKFIEIFGHA